jgi:hypothetical protein
VNSPDEEYFTWLYSLVASTNLKNPSRTHWSLARHLYTKEFVWLVPNDDNRVQDGKDLRREFFEVNEISRVDQNWVVLGCSMFEMLIALSRTLSFEADGEPRVWFWHLMETLDLFQYNDRIYKTRPEVASIIDETIDQVIWRQYEPDGKGGLFPLRNPREDQREVEIWYQLNAYLLELS